MISQVGSSSDFTETVAIHSALKLALKSKHFDKNPALKRTALSMCKDLESEKSVYGRQLKMLALMQRGASVDDLGRKLKCSRRTLFRYLNYLEEAGIEVRLEGGKYKVDKKVLKMMGA